MPFFLAWPQIPARRRFDANFPGDLGVQTHCQLWAWLPWGGYHDNLHLFAATYKGNYGVFSRLERHCRQADSQLRTDGKRLPFQAENVIANVYSLAPKPGISLTQNEIPGYVPV